MGWTMKLDKHKLDKKSYNLMVGFHMHSNEFGSGTENCDDIHDFSTLDDSDKEDIIDLLWRQ